MSANTNMEIIVEDKIEKVLCAIKLPENKSKKGWFFNIFLQHIYSDEKKIDRNEIRVNYLIAITREEIKKLRKNTCKVYPLIEDLSFEIEESSSSQYKEGFKVLLDLFNKTMKDPTIKIKIKDLLVDKKGNPNNSYKTIMSTKKLLGGK